MGHINTALLAASPSERGSPMASAFVALSSKVARSGAIGFSTAIILVPLGR